MSTAIPTGNPSLKIHVTDTADGINGDMTFQLFQDLAPNTVSEIEGLVNQGFYNSLTFHRVISGFMIQGGDPNGDGTGGPGFQFDDEFNARSAIHQSGHPGNGQQRAGHNGSQFFCHGRTDPLGRLQLHDLRHADQPAAIFSTRSITSQPTRTTNRSTP